MNGLSVTQESTIRISCFLGALLAMAAWELFSPRRRLRIGKSRRWASNLGLVCLNVVLVRLILPFSALRTAVVAADRGWGLLNQWAAPVWARFLITIVVLDFAIYLQHVLFHAVPALWRLHSVHHADIDIDVTTGLRFHTLEILISTFLKIGAVFALGPPLWSVLAFEILLNGTSMFNHSNVRISPRLDRLLRLFIVTPDMHRVHHSVERQEANTNFGFNLPWWDFLLRTYRAQPAAGHDGMQIGVSYLRDELTADRLPGMLAIPFTSAAGEYPISGARSA